MVARKQIQSLSFTSNWDLDMGHLHFVTNSPYDPGLALPFSVPRFLISSCRYIRVT